MSLYDDIDYTSPPPPVSSTSSGGEKKTDNGSGALLGTTTTSAAASSTGSWANSIKFMQTHVQLKKKSFPQPKKELRARQHLAPVIDFKGKSLASATAPNVPTNVNSSDDRSTITTVSSTPSFILPYSISSKKSRGGGAAKTSFSFIAVDPDWQFENEYDPYYPNEYEKALKDLRERRDREAEEEEAKRKLTTDAEGGDGNNRDQEEEDRGERSRSDKGKGGGVAIAPPPSLNIGYDDDSSSSLSHLEGKYGGKASSSSYGLGAGSGASAAAKIMAKYGYKEGQGLGRMEQGMSTALQVEKTSHRIGRIIHEKDVPKEGVVSLLGTPPNLAASYMDDDEFEMEPPLQEQQEEPPHVGSYMTKTQQDQHSEEQLRNPTKIVLLTNMVGPGEVDDDLEPEVKEECLKYGEVVTVIVFQMPDVDSEDSIRIFVEFTLVSSAISAFRDLNGRFFGGRQVKASFYDPEKFNNLELTL